jgi:hypothetical protein
MNPNMLAKTLGDHNKNENNNKNSENRPRYLREKLGVINFFILVAVVFICHFVKNLCKTEHVFIARILSLRYVK